MVLQECFCSSARRAARVLTARYEAALAPHTLTVPQFEMLALLHNHARNGRSIAHAMGLDAATVSRNVKHLLGRRQGFAARAGADDARLILYKLTPHGAATFKKAYPDWRAAQKRAAQSLPRGSLELLRAIAESAP